MNLPIALNLQLSWPLWYRDKSIKGLTGLKIVIQNLVDNKSLDNNNQKNINISLLSRLLLIVNEKFNLVSLEGGIKNGVNAVINIPEENVNDFKNSIKRVFEKFTKIFDYNINLRYEDTPPKNYYITNGLTIFELINSLNKKIIFHRNKAGKKVITAWNLLKISSGDTYSHLSTLELDLECKDANKLDANKFWSRIRALARAYNISFI